MRMTSAKSTDTEAVNNKIRKIGIVVMPLLSVGGGFARSVRDLIVALNSMNKEVHLLTPFGVDLRKIAELYGPVRINKIYRPGKIKSFFCREESLGRKLLINKFKKMAESVDFIIDTEGGVLHNYLPDNFDKSKYIIWKLSCIDPNTSKKQNYTNIKIIIKNFMRKFTLKEKDIPRGVRIYSIDQWTNRQIMRFWKTRPQDFCLYSDIKIEDFRPSRKKEDIIVVLGRIAPNKSIMDAVKIFYKGTKNFPQYKLVIIGGITPETNNYLREIKSLTDSKGITNRVEIIKDPSFKEIVDVLARSKVSICAQIGVSMNMPTIEAMASGCIAMMRRYSGTYEEVSEFGKYGYGFDSIEEGGSQLEEILGELKKGRINNKSSIKKAEFFSTKNFNWRLKKILNES